MLKRITLTEVEKNHPHIREAISNIHSGLWIDIDAQELEFYSVDCSMTVIAVFEENIWTFNGVIWHGGINDA